MIIVRVGDIKAEVIKLADDGLISETLYLKNILVDSSGKYRLHTDEVFITDSPYVALVRYLNDEITVSEFAALALSKHFQEEVHISTAINVEANYLRSVMDTITIQSGQPNFKLTSSLTDATQVSDSTILSWLFKESFSDGFFVDDLMGVGDGLEFEIVKTLTNLVSVADSNQIKAVKGFTDSYSTSDGGSLAIQDYCVLGYFEAGYIGSAVTF